MSENANISIVTIDGTSRHEVHFETPTNEELK